MGKKKRVRPSDFSAFGAVDSHAHIDSSVFAGEVDSVIANALAHDVRGIVAIAADEDRDCYRRVTELTRKYEAIRMVAGIHPHYASNHEELWPALMELFSHSDAPGSRQCRPVGLGEFGLDFHYDLSPRNLQRDLMRRQLEFALRRTLPIVLHIREAIDEALSILDEYSDSHDGVIHCFNWGLTEANEFLRRGFHISLPGIVTFPRCEELREAVAGIPVDRLLVETDSPYLAPEPFRGHRNEPALVAFVVQTVADIKRVSASDMARILTCNTERLFRTSWNQSSTTKNRQK